MPIPLPPPNTIAHILGELVGRSVIAKTAAVARIEPRLQVIAEYRNESAALLALAACDVPLGASFAAALTMVPPVRVDECVKAKRLDDTLAENLHEVFNVLAAVFPKSGAPRVILRCMHHCEEVSGDVAAALAKPSRRLDLEVAVAGYRGGKLAIIAA